MEKIRVLIANHPRLMRDLVLATISDQPDMELAGEVAGDDNIVNAMVACPGPGPTVGSMTFRWPS